MQPVVDAIALLEGIAERMLARAKLLRQVLADCQADLKQLDQLAAAAPDALRAGDARVDAGVQPPQAGEAPR